MDDFANEMDEACIEILLPERDGSTHDHVVCLCCQKARPKNWMDDDGCGICEECIAL